MWCPEDTMTDCRVEDWRQLPRRFSLSVAPRFLWECLTSRTVGRFSSPRLVKPSVRFSRTGLSCLLHAKAYETYPAGRAFGSGRRTRYKLNSPSSPYSHDLLHRFEPKPFRFFARLRCRRIFFSTQSLINEKHSLSCPSAYFFPLPRIIGLITSITRPSPC